MSYNNKHYSDLGSLEELAKRAQGFTSEVAWAAAEAVAELEGAKADKARGIYYGVCGTAAATAAKAVTISGITELYTGLTLILKCTNAQTYNGAPTLNLNSLGAKTIKRIGTTNAARYEWSAGEVIILVYDGTYWMLLDAAFATTTYYGVVKLNSATNSTSTTEAATPSAVKAAYDLAAAALPKPTSVSMTLPTTGWTANTSVDPYQYYYDYAVSGLTTAKKAVVTLAVSSVDTAARCGLSPICETVSGAIRFRAEKVPTAAISASYELI